MYTSRFLVLNKICLKIFKSRESFLRLQKPQQEIPISSIKDCNYIQMNNQKGNKNSHYYISYVLNTSISDSKIDDKIESKN